MPSDPIFGVAPLVNPLTGFAQIQGLAQQAQQDAASRTAGLALAGGDYAGASNALGGAGMLGQQRVVNDDAIAAGNRTAQSDVLGLIDQGQYDQAQTRAAAAGNVNLFNAAGEEGDAHRDAAKTLLSHGIDAALATPDPAARHALLQKYAPMLKDMGADPDAVDSLETGSLDDQSLLATKALLGTGDQYKITKGDDGQWVRENVTRGTIDKIYQGQAKPMVVGNNVYDPVSGQWHMGPQKPDVRIERDGQGVLHVIQVGGDGTISADASGSVGTAPAPSGGAYDAMATTAQAAGASPAEVDYMRRVMKVESSGQAGAQNGSSTGYFQMHPATFAAAGGGDIHSLADQTRAMVNLTRSDAAALQANGLPITPANLYVMHQQGAGGGIALLKNPDAPAAQTLAQVYKNPTTAQQAITGNRGDVNMTGAQFASHISSQFGNGQATTAPSSSGLVRELGTVGAPKAGTAAAPINIPDNATGADVLAALPKAQGDQVKALAEGRMQFPSGAALRSPYWQSMLQAVGQYDPSFDAVNYNARSATRKDFTSGKSAVNITSLNTAIGHLGALSDSIANLHNSPIPAINGLAHAVQGAIGDPRFADFSTKADAVADEMTRVFRGTGGSVSDVKAWRDKLNNANSPAQLNAVVTAGTELLHSRLDAIGAQYQKGMGTTADPMTLLTPHAQQVLGRLAGSNPQAAAAPIPSAPIPPPAAVQMLKENPGLRPAYDAKYGQGASNRVLGR